MLGRLASLLADAQSALARLDGMASRLLDAHSLLRAFWAREAVLSSRIENIETTVEAVALAGAVRGQASEDVLETRNYIQALEYALGSPLPLGAELFRKMHGVLMSGVRGEDKTPGEIRDVQVYIGSAGGGFAGARFVPPPPGEELARCLREFERFLGAGPVDMPALIAIALAHYQFECIHPFRDGNGRLGRLLLMLQLCREGFLSKPWFYVSGHFERRRRDYYDLLLAVSTRGAWEEWVEFFLRGIATQARDALRRADKLAALRDRYRAAVTDRRTASLLIRLVDSLFESPAVSIRDVAERLGVTYKPAHKYIQALEDRGILARAGDGNYGKVYVAREILGIIEAEDA